VSVIQYHILLHRCCRVIIIIWRSIIQTDEYYYYNLSFCLTHGSAVVETRRIFECAYIIFVRFATSGGNSVILYYYHYYYYHYVTRQRRFPSRAHIIYNNNIHSTQKPTRTPQSENNVRIRAAVVISTI